MENPFAVTVPVRHGWSRMRRMVWKLLGAVVAVCLTVGLGCRPEIGDPCTTSIECPEGGTCDTTTLGGYCLKYDCEFSSCPDGSVCVEFPTFTACMQHCSSNADCRVSEGYVCRDDLEPAPFCYVDDELAAEE